MCSFPSVCIFDERKTSFVRMRRAVDVSAFASFAFFYVSGSAIRGCVCESKFFMTREDRIFSSLFFFCDREKSPAKKKEKNLITNTPENSTPHFYF